MEWLFRHQQKIGLVSLLICVVAYLVVRLVKKKPLDEKMAFPLIVAAFTGFAIPQGFFLLYCSFDLSKLREMEDLRLFLGVASVCAILVATVTAVKSIAAAKK